MMNRRINYVDTYKAIGILLMMLSHVYVPIEIDNYIHVFHMPMFFFVSGYLFNKNVNAKGFIKKKFIGLIVPYLIFSISYYVLWTVVKGFTLEPLKVIFYINSNNIPVSNGLWFLTALFFTNIISYYIDKIKPLPLKVMIITIISFVGITLYKYTNVLLPLSLQASFAGVGFFFIGYYIKKDTFIKSYFQKYSICLSVLLLIICIILVPQVGYVAMRVNNYENVFLFYPASICCCIFILICSYKLNKTVSINNFINKINIIGKRSLMYLCLNEPVINTIRQFTSKIDSVFIGNLICFLSSIIVITIMSELYYMGKKAFKSYLFKK